MKILVIQESDWIRRNPHQQHHLFDRLSLRGHRIKVIDYPIDWRKNEPRGLIYPRRLFKGIWKVKSEARIDVIRPTILKLPIFDYLSIPITHTLEIRKQIREFKPDVIVGFGIINTYIGLKEAKKRGIPFVYYPIDVLYTLIPEKTLQVIGKWLMKKILKSADFVITINKRLRQLMIEMGANPYDTVVIEAGIDLEKFNPNLDGSRIRKKYGIKDDEILLFFMGYLYEFSGLKELALEMAKKDHPRIKLMIVGEGEAYNDLQNIKEKNNLENLILAGSQPYEMIPEFLAAADICILPARREEKIMQDIVPIKIYEYLAMAKPVIATGFPGIKMEFGEDNGIYYIEKPEDVLKTASELATGDLQVEGMKGRKFVESNDWETITDKFEKTLKNLVGLRAPGGD
ncbi:glycosyltransferase [Methanothermobacter tenebrarum]|uniref:Glycosyl transferase GT4 family protein n=1 Tax=Methanothermobacter tenebrarum TaxID=680118 RepID=A0A328PBZ6_9EURY|nr:glycosyltransferase [Methanothermobacter tenebrarum]MBC7101484.1 glycosyltransferase [Methanobacteriales archaeon]NPV64611.1 glycosyltransferase [Methanobacteriaceae archaeon]RAO78661.1 glycosyl transferase GT4 family protein [Methanothermobacter tenebrarum]